MRDFNPNPAPPVSADFSDCPKRDDALLSRLRVNLPPRIKPDPANRHDPQPPEPGTSLPFDGTPERAAHIVGWAAAPGIVGAALDGTASGGVECVLWVRTPADGAQPVPHGKCLYRGTDGCFSVVANAEADAALAELRRLCEGVDPFAPTVQAAARPSTRDT